jgi:hypothetical protein
MTSNQRPSGDFAINQLRRLPISKACRLVVVVWGMYRLCGSRAPLAVALPLELRGDPHSAPGRQICAVRRVQDSVAGVEVNAMTDRRSSQRWDPAAGRRFLRFALWSPAGLGTIAAMLVLVALLPPALKEAPVIFGAVALVFLARKKGI